MTIDEMTSKLKSSLIEKRFVHSLGVMEMSVELAKHYGADVKKAEIAGLLYDCAKNLSVDEMLQKCEYFGIKLDSIMQQSFGLIHGLVGAYMARTEYGIDDDDIFDAIYYHTIGKPDMSLLTQIVYIADGIEKHRRYDGVERIRELAFENLDRALVLLIDSTIKSVITRGGLLHTGTVNTRNYYLKKIR